MLKLSCAYMFSVENFSLSKTLNCGQLCRAHRCSDNSYLVLSGSKYCVVSQAEDIVTVRMPNPADRDYWCNYFNFEEDLQEFKEIMSTTPFLREAYQFSKGIRILKQEPWEATVSFIISQRNNVPRTKQCVERVCEATGDPLGYGFFAFPKPSDIAPKNLANCGLGYRESYLYAASFAVSSGELKLGELHAGKCTKDRAIQELLRLQGVGIKVASCISLFGLGHMSAWPVDVWIERAMSEGSISYGDVELFGDHAGLVQQYVYYYMTERNVI